MKKIWFHSSPAYFTQFDLKHSTDLGFHFGTELAALDRGRTQGWPEVELTYWEPSAEEKALVRLERENPKDPKQRLLLRMLQTLEYPVGNLEEILEGTPDEEILELLSEMQRHPESAATTSRRENGGRQAHWRIQINGIAQGKPIYDKKEATDQYEALKNEGRRPLMCRLHIKNPREIQDLGVWPLEEMTKELGLQIPMGKNLRIKYGGLRRQLNKKGIDALIYENKVEDPGSTSILVWDLSKIEIIRKNSWNNQPSI